MEQTVRIVSLREEPEKFAAILSYVKLKWASEETQAVYDDCILHTLTSNSTLPQWYALFANDEIIGCAGLITNDFISRMDLWPWLCAVYVEEHYRGQFLSQKFVARAMEDTRQAGFNRLFLATDHVGFYEQIGFEYLGDGYHPWGEKSRIYKKEL